MVAWKQGCNTDGELLRDVYVEHDAVDLDCQAADDGMTRQEFKDECDINVLMATYERNGSLNHFNRVVPAYLDVSDVPDLMQSIDYLDRAQTAFMTLPASVRREFDNNAVQFVDFAQKPESLSKLREWGLAAPEKAAGAEIMTPPVSASSGVSPAAPAAASAVPKG